MHDAVAHCAGGREAYVFGEEVGVLAFDLEDAASRILIQSGATPEPRVPGFGGPKRHVGKEWPLHRTKPRACQLMKQ